MGVARADNIDMNAPLPDFLASFSFADIASAYLFGYSIDLATAIPCDSGAGCSSCRYAIDCAGDNQLMHV